MKIFIPVSVTKRLPEIPDGEFAGPCVIVRYVNKNVSESFNALAFAYCDRAGRWEDAMPKEIGKSVQFAPYSNNEVIEWFDEVELESLFPEKEHSSFVANNASNGRINGAILHQEGQDFIKNFIVKQIKK